MLDSQDESSTRFVHQSPFGPKMIKLSLYQPSCTSVSSFLIEANAKLAQLKPTGTYNPNMEDCQPHEGAIRTDAGSR